MRRAGLAALSSLCLLAVGLAGCKESDSTVYVAVSMDDGVSGVTSLQVAVSMAGAHDLKAFPEHAGGAPLPAATSFVLILPRSRTGTVDLAVDGIDGNGQSIGQGTTQASLVVGGTATTAVRLVAGQQLCGNGRLDPGESCDDGNRYSYDGCDFRCQVEGGKPDAGADSAQNADAPLAQDAGHDVPLFQDVADAVAHDLPGRAEAAAESGRETADDAPAWDVGAGGTAVDGRTGAGGVGGTGAGGNSGAGGTAGTDGGTSTGGATSTGGLSGTGGATSTGGASASGGVTSAGGTTGTGGTTSTGGISTGGATASGGVTGTGGVPGTGGQTFHPIVEIPVPTAASEPFAITQGSDGNLWFTEYQASKIGRITPAGAMVEIALADGSQPHGIVGGPDGNLWFAETGTNKIGRLTPSGSLVEFPLPTAGAAPYEIAFGADNNLWFTESAGNKIGRITSAGVIVEFALPTVDSQPLGIAPGPDGNIWFTEYNNNKIGRITPTGTITEFGGVTRPWGIVGGFDLNLWFTEDAAVGRITPAGTVSHFPLSAPTGPRGITAGPDHNTWFADATGNKIGRITPEGIISEVEVPTNNAFPVHVTTGPNGDLWFTEQTGNSIAHLAP